MSEIEACMRGSGQSAPSTPHDCDRESPTSSLTHRTDVVSKLPMWTSAVNSEASAQKSLCGPSTSVRQNPFTTEIGSRWGGNRVANEEASCEVQRARAPDRHQTEAVTCLRRPLPRSPSYAHAFLQAANKKPQPSIRTTLAHPLVGTSDVALAQRLEAEVATGPGAGVLVVGDPDTCEGVAAAPVSLKRGQRESLERSAAEDGVPGCNRHVALQVIDKLGKEEHFDVAWPFLHSHIRGSIQQPVRAPQTG
eukprot:807541-Rhodomonas_salina.2